MDTIITALIIYFGVINVLTFAIFGFDKMMARTRSWRIPEMMLWLLALLGGSVGALVGMNTFRHKTRKVSFQFVLAVIILLQAGGLYAYAYFAGLA